MLSRIALLAIAGYQRHLSPRKGYGCAYRLAHGGTGCSGFAKAAISDAGMIRALPAIRSRLIACRDAAEELRDRRAKGEKRGKWDCSSGCDCSSCFDLPCGRIKGPDLTPDGCDCTPDCCSL